MKYLFLFIVSFFTKLSEPFIINKPIIKNKCNTLLKSLPSDRITFDNIVAYDSIKEELIQYMDLIKNKSKSIIAIGDELPSELHSLVFILNQELKNNNNSVTYHSTNDFVKSDLESTKKLIEKINSGNVDDLFILDVMMPGEDGLSLTKKLLNHRKMVKIIEKKW